MGLFNFGQKAMEAEMQMCSCGSMFNAEEIKAYEKKEDTKESADKCCCSEDSEASSCSDDVDSDKTATEL